MNPPPPSPVPPRDPENPTKPDQLLSKPNNPPENDQDDRVAPETPANALTPATPEIESNTSPSLSPEENQPASAAPPDDASMDRRQGFSAACGSETYLDERRFEKWKIAIRHDFEAWLNSIEEIPLVNDLENETEVPDLYAFFEQLAIANTESRKTNRRTAEAFSQWNDVLSHFEDELKRLREQLGRLPDMTSQTETLPLAHARTLVELLDRMQRIAAAFQMTPVRSWWEGTTAWQKAWHTQRQAFDILMTHFTSLLNREGITRLNTVGQPFDPVLMTAVASEPDSRHPHHTVLEEITAGYRHGDTLLRPAQVKVAINQTIPGNL